jgi:hypothetical protein
VAVTVSTLISYLRQTYPDCGDALGLRAIQRTVRALVQPDDTRTETTTLSSLVAGTADYALNESVIRVWSADYQPAATQSKRLTAVTMSQLERDYPNHRVASSGAPQVFAVTYSGSALQLTLHPAPDTTTAGGYPRVILRTSTVPTLASNSTLPANLPEEAIEAGALWRVARVLDPAKAPAYEALWRQQLASARAEMVQRAAGARYELDSDDWSWDGGGVV